MNGRFEWVIIGIITALAGVAMLGSASRARGAKR